MLQTHACLSSPLHSKLLESRASVLLRYSYAQCLVQAGYSGNGDPWLSKRLASRGALSSPNAAWKASTPHLPFRLYVELFISKSISEPLRITFGESENANLVGRADSHLQWGPVAAGGGPELRPWHWASFYFQAGEGWKLQAPLGMSYSPVLPVEKPKYSRLHPEGMTVRTSFPGTSGDFSGAKYIPGKLQTQMRSYLKSLGPETHLQVEWETKMNCMWSKGDVLSWRWLGGGGGVTSATRESPGSLLCSRLFYFFKLVFNI